MEGKPRNGLAGPVVGEFVPPREVDETEEAVLPDTKDYLSVPARFGSVPVATLPLGYEKKSRGYFGRFPRVDLPTQVIERVSFGHPELEPNRLFWGDNLHVMRGLDTESIDLIYIDPPFFSGRNYNVIFGDQNEQRSFSDIWEGGMPGYLIWLNARLVEMKRLLKKTGCIAVHVDWHASHYIKVELDKIFGFENFMNEVIWHYKRWPTPAKEYMKMHDVILFYKKQNGSHYFHKQYGERTPETQKRWSNKRIVASHDATGARRPSENESVESPGAPLDDVWDMPIIAPVAKERIGYPTQKPEALLARIIQGSCPPEGVVADFFSGGGTTASVAQKLGRRWITCDQSRVAVAITADRLAKAAEQRALSNPPSPSRAVVVPDLEPLQPNLDSSDFSPSQPTLTTNPSLNEALASGEVDPFAPTPDFTVEHWGVYERDRLAQTPASGFRAFVLVSFAAKPANESGFHGRKGKVPVWIGSPDPKRPVEADEVVAFANAIRATPEYAEDNLRDGILLAWGFSPAARVAAERLATADEVRLDFVRLEPVTIESPRFREHISRLSTEHADYENFLTFVQPPQVELGAVRKAGLAWAFDVGDTAVLNAGAKIINVQWDFDYRDGRFTSTAGFAFGKGSVTAVEYTFPSPGRKRIAVKVQDDLGGEGMATLVLDV